MSEEIILKSGDCIFAESRHHGLSIKKVERLTKTQYILEDGTRLRIPFYDHSTAIGDGGYGSTYYRKDTPERRNEFLKQNQLYKIGKIDFKKFDTDTLEQILNILKP